MPLDSTQAQGSPGIAGLQPGLHSGSTQAQGSPGIAGLQPGLEIGGA